MCMRVGFSQRKKGLLSAFALSRNLKARVADFVVHGLHPFGIERVPRLRYCCFPTLPQRGITVGSSTVGGPAVDHVARADFVQKLLRIAGVCWIFHRIQMIEIAEEFFEPMHSRQKLVFVAEVVLAELASSATHCLERRRDRRCFDLQP